MSAASQPLFRFFAELDVQISPAIEIGQTSLGRRRIIPITGGTVRGQNWQGRVLPAGADFQLLLGDRLAHLDARYVIETETGSQIYVHNHAVRSGPAELMQQLARGEYVDPEKIYFRCCPQLESAYPQFAWVNERLFFGIGERHPNFVRLTFHELL